MSDMSEETERPAETAHAPNGGQMIINPVPVEPSAKPPLEIQIDPNADPHAAQANAIITAGIAATAGMGWLPAFVDTGWLVVANSGMVTALAALYQFKWTGDNTRAFIQRLISDGGLTIMAVKGLSALLDLTGIGLPLGIAINGTLNAGLTLAIGKAAQHYFKNAGDVPDDDLIAVFRSVLRGTRLSR